MPCSPIFAATSRGTGTRVPPPPRGVALRTPWNLGIVSTEILSRDHRPLGVRSRVSRWGVAHKRWIKAESKQLVRRRTLREGRRVQGRGLQGAIVPPARV